MGIECYMAEHDVQPGVTLKDKLKQRILAADCVLVFITKGSLGSDWVKWEVGIADGQGKLIIPVIEKGVDIPAFLLGKEYISFDPRDVTTTAQAVSQYLARQKIEQERRQQVGWLILGGLAALFILTGKE